ncbi:MULTISPECIES: hypothetical protein [Acidobacteriaceae]|uniref:hypothetical protein n=1 Tax=Acidobacteriaceae TaxID=204434 RepID=UPI00131C2AE0|nr:MULTISPECIES: hypothetical protein [Acidobacteriaceae]MDW5267796.1 hypothetical protein [Edaphobacter sp.]
MNPEAIREQLESIVQDPAFRSSKRSIQFLRYVVEKTLSGAADQIKERTIGVEVFGRPPSYDTNEDHIVRTAAGELRKRLAIYYGEEKHRSELRMSLVPGSYIPQFKLPEPAGAVAEADAGIDGTNGLASIAIAEPELKEPLVGSRPAERSWKNWYTAFTVAMILLIACFGYLWLRPQSAQALFWRPVVETPGAVLLAVGDVPNGPPSSTAGDTTSSLPIIHKTSSTTVPFADAVTTARVLGVLQLQGKRVMIRREEASSFSDLREGPVVLIGAFNNEWSLRLTQQLRYSLALDAEKHLIYIKDAKNPSLRTWSWATDKSTDDQGAAGGPALMDYALISRIWNSETGHVVIVVGGLYTYGTETAGEFLSDPQLMQTIASQIPENSHTNLQIVLGTTVTDAVAGPPRVLAVSTE